MNISEQAKILAENVIIIHLEYRSSEVDMTVLESRYSCTNCWSDKIANFGGMFGIWAELTGFSLLGIINVCLIVLKISLAWLTSWKIDFKPSSAQDTYPRKVHGPVLEEKPQQARIPTFEEGMENASFT